MKLARSLVSLSLIFSTAILSFIALPMPAQAQDAAKIALQRGYRTGYSDGYMAGYRDSIDANDKNYTRHSEYAKADRAYNKDYGTIEDYKDGYQQGFESGYDTGFGKRSFDAAIPVNIARRGTAQAKPAVVEPVNEPVAQPVSEPIVEAQTAVTAPVIETPVTTPSDEPATTESAPERPAIQKVAYVTTDDPVIIIPRDTEIILELDEAMDTERNREGDKFTARVVSPVEIAGARIEGHVDKVVKPGRIKRRSEMLLSFDRLVVTERRWTNFDAILTEVLPIKGDNVKTVDTEGTAIGKSTLKPDLIKVGVATGAGAGIGLIGGPVGAAVGAGVGAAFGVGAVVVERGKHIKLNQAQQLRIKTSYETQIR
ncbi:MAG: hypothetical protein PSX80_03955 [bacterium]|nr:hypothetical protein [bacterium]